MNITQEEYENHDCKSGPESACRGCEIWIEQMEREKAASKPMVPVRTKSSTVGLTDAQLLDAENRFFRDHEEFGIN